MSETVVPKHILLITGDRNWSDFKLVRKALEPWSKHARGEVVVIHGDCRGADKIAGFVATKEFHYRVEAKPADWRLYGKSAGPKRNEQMVKDAIAHRSRDSAAKVTVLAFHDTIDKSVGTKHCIEVAKRAGLEVVLNSH